MLKSMYRLKKKILLVTLIFYGICVILFSYWGLSSVEQSQKSETMKLKLYSYENFMWLLESNDSEFQFHSGLDPTPFPPELPR